MRITVGDIRNSLIPRALGVCDNDVRIPKWATAAQERLGKSGKWWGTYGHYRICANNGCVTMPRTVASVEQAAVCSQPVIVRDQWFEYLGSGFGLRGTCGCGLWGEALAMGRFATFSDIVGVNKCIKLVCDVAADVGTSIIVTGYDQDGNWIRTQQSSVWANGEAIALAQGAGTLSTTLFTEIKDILVPNVLNGQWWLYEHDTTANTDRLIGQYEYNDVRPSFARYRFPSLHSNADQSLCACQQNVKTPPPPNARCDKTTTTPIDVMAKNEIFPVVLDSDYLLLENMNALQVMMEGVVNAMKEPDNLRKDQILALAQAAAERLLDSELTHYRGDGVETGINILGSSVGYVEPVHNFI